MVYNSTSSNTVSVVILYHLPFIVPPPPPPPMLILPPGGIVMGIAQVMDNKFTLIFTQPSNIYGMLEYVYIVTI